MKRATFRRTMAAAAGLFLAVALPAPLARAQDANLCDVPGEAPDLIVSNLDAVTRWGTVDGITAYSIGATDCNVGSCWLDYFASTNRHPVFGHNLFRLEGGKFEQLGQSWLSHRFFALSGNACGGGCEPTNGSHLGVQCSSPNSATTSGAQNNLAPKFEVDASSGDFPFPFTGQGATGNLIFKRLQARNADLDPALHPSALFFLEGQSVAPDDAAAGVGPNNAAWRPVGVAAGTFHLTFIGPTRAGQAAIEAWVEHDPAVTLDTVDVPDDGRFLVASRATPLGGGVWHYEFAIQNLTSHRSAMTVRVPIPAGATVTNLGFHDVDYHSGEPFDGTDWPGAVDLGTVPHAVVWSTQSFAENPDANALRWGTLYNFRFDADVPPAAGTLAVGLFRPGAPDSVTAEGTVPELCDQDSFCEVGESPCNCAADCGSAAPTEFTCAGGADDDCDGLTDCLDGDCCGAAPCPMDDADADARLACEDCDDGDGSIWATPGEVAGLLAGKDSQDRVILDWAPPDAPGGLVVAYETLRSPDPADFLTLAVCLAVPDPSVPGAVDAAIPTPGSVFHYLVRATNACPLGTGPLGSGSDGAPRPAASCP
jgi:hypothetical protein